MLGIGDNIYQRAVLHTLQQRYDVTLQSYYISMFHDLVKGGLKIVPISSIARARIKEAGQVSVPDAPLAKVPWKFQKKITYDRIQIRRAGSILAAQFASCGLPMPKEPDFSLPVPAQWRESAKEIIKTWKTGGKPLLVYRPIVLNRVWECPSRSPDPVAYGKIFKSIRDRFFVISIADLTQKEWLVGAEQEADIKLHRGELQFETLAGLFAEADIVFANPGFAPVLAQAVGTPVVIVYGGNETHRTTNSVGDHLAPTLAIEPINPCACHARYHGCDKRIDVLAALERVKTFTGRICAS